MKITNDLYLKIRVYDENNREAWLVNEKTEKQLRVAQLFRHVGKWFVWSLFEGHEKPDKKEAIKHFNYIVSTVSDDFRFLLNK